MYLYRREDEQSSATVDYLSEIGGTFLIYPLATHWYTQSGSRNLPVAVVGNLNLALIIC